MPACKCDSAWRIQEDDYSGGRSLEERLRFLVGNAILAPSSHNTQPWQFSIVENRVDIFADQRRWLKVADADRRELFISVGCALENLLVAAEHFGLGHEVTYFPRSDDRFHVARVRFTTAGSVAKFREPQLFDMITVRHTNHREYATRSISDKCLTALKNCCVERDIVFHLTSDAAIKRAIGELAVRGDAIQFADPAFRNELGYWIGQGVFGTSWLMSKLGQLAITHINMGKSTAKKDLARLLSAPVVAVLCSRRNDHISQVKVGQVFQRISLLAVSHGIWTQPISQIVQVPDLKKQLAELIPLAGVIPQHPFRLGYAEAEPRHAPRRSLDEVIQK